MGRVGGKCEGHGLMDVSSNYVGDYNNTNEVYIKKIYSMVTIMRNEISSQGDQL